MSDFMSNMDLIRRQDVNRLIDEVLENNNLQASSTVWYCLHRIKELPSAQPYTDEEIQKMQDLEQAELQKAYELGKEESEVIRCKDCKWWGYDDDDGVYRVCHAAKHGYISSHWDISIYRTYKGDFYCADAERR